MKTTSRWYSHRLDQDINVVRWGHGGQPVLVFPTAGGDAEEIERFKMIDVLRPLIDAGRIRVYSCDSVAGRAWLTEENSPAHCAWVQNQFDQCVYHEIVPAIRSDCADAEIEVITAGASIGAFNAVATLCRHPDVVRSAIALSGTYNLERFLQGTPAAGDFYFCSPLHYLPGLNSGSQLELARTRFVLMAFGQGRWEDPQESWRMAEVLGAKQIANRVDPWGPEWDHDWPTWRAMLPRYLAELA